MNSQDSSRTNQENPTSDKKRDWRFFSDRPVGLDNNLLWKDDKTDLVWQQVDDIASRLVEPLHFERSSSNAYSDALTFAIHGDWGSGKTSFQKMIEERAIQLAGNEKNRIKFCYYVASTYINLDVDVRTTLAMQVLTALADGDRQKALTRFGTIAFDKQDDDTENRDRRGDDLQIGKDLSHLAQYLSRLVDFPDILSKELKGYGQINPFGPGVPGVMVILIDDLDRCPLKTVTDILNTTQQWGQVQNLFFILAINRTVLVDAIKERSPELKIVEDKPDYALEKYVQHTVTVPSLDGERLEDYVKRLLETYEDEVSRAIAENIKYLATGLGIKTPRAVKRCLNTIRPDIKAQIKAGQDPQKILKELILQYSWRDFYNRFFVPSVKTPHSSRFRRAWEQLESNCKTYVEEAERLRDSDEEKLDFLLNRVKSEYQDEQFPKRLDRDLVRYLAQPPYWLFGVSEETRATEPSKMAARIPITLTEQQVLRPVRSLDIDREFLRLYDQSTAALEGEKPDIETGLRYALQASQFLQENLGQIPSYTAKEICALAYLVEKFRSYELADLLYQIALEIKPNDANNIQYYLGFIVSKEWRARYSLAFDLLDRLETIPELKAFLPENRIYLKAKMYSLTSRNPEGMKEEIVNFVRNKPIDLQVYRYAMFSLRYVGSYELMREVAEITLKPEYANSLSYVYQRTNLLAASLTYLKNHPDASNEALEIYRRLLTHPEWIDPSDRAYIHFDYANTLSNQNYNEEAGKQYYNAYKLNPENLEIRESYARYMVEANRKDLAEKVILGQPISEMVLQPVNGSVPPQFSDAEYIDEAFKLMERLASRQQSL